MNPTAAKLIKIASILSMTCALGLLGWNLSLHLQGKSLPPNLTFFSGWELSPYLLMA